MKVYSPHWNEYVYKVLNTSTNRHALNLVLQYIGPINITFLELPEYWKEYNSTRLTRYDRVRVQSVMLEYEYGLNTSLIISVRVHK